MQEEPHNRTRVNIKAPILKPKFTNIGYGNPRYNSMIVCPDSTVLVSCGPTLRKVDLRKQQILLNKQIGSSQIFQIMENKTFIFIINFEGLITLLNKETYEIVKQFYAYGKEIRHSSVTEEYLAVSCQLNQQFKQQAMLQIYKIQDILKKQGKQIQVNAFVSKKGFYYYPQIVQQDLICIQYHDPNPKGRSRTETVLNKKLPIKHKILRFTIKTLETCQPKHESIIQSQGQILCTAKNTKQNTIFYLHQSKKITLFSCNHNKHYQTVLQVSSAPHCIQPYKNGIIYPSKSSQLAYLCYNHEKNVTNIQKISIKSLGIGGNFSVKILQISQTNNDFYLFNQHGLHLYCSLSQQTFSQNCFDITNCGISLNKDASLFTVADFGGNIYTFTTQDSNIVPNPLTRVTVGIPIRSLAWCHDSNKIVFGCVGGGLFSWDGADIQAQFVNQYNCTVNIIRSYQCYVLVGTADGFVHILHSVTLEELYSFQAHYPINYENQKDRQLFGSMKNYAEIWSITAFPLQKQGQFHIVTASQDQTQKVFRVAIKDNGTFSHEQVHHLVGHSLAVTSIDWKNMGKQLNQVYVSCSDDKIVRFRNPHNMFEIVHQLETSTIKQWHTLTYLALQPNGHRVAIGSQNGYLFIFDIHAKQLLFGQKIHLGGIQGLDWNNNKLVTCSSDLCISVITF